MKRIALALFLSVLMSASVASAQGHRSAAEPALDKNLMELPAIGSADVILVYNGFIVNYNTERLIPNWVAYELTADEVKGEQPRSNNFSMDLDYKDRQAMREDYSNSGWDKGHMAPAADMKWSQTAMCESFYLTNICPQDHTLNSRDWHLLEKNVRDWAARYGSVWVVCGPYVSVNQYGTIGERKVVIPDGFFKAVLRKEGNEWYSIAFLFKNDSSSQPVKDAVVPVNQVEEMLGYDLFFNLDDQIENTVESQADYSAWK